MTPSPTDTADRRAIEAAIPHRAPFLLLDRIVEGPGASALTATDGVGASLVSEWRVPPDAEWVAGHYPGQPVLPGALLSEHVFQSGAVLVSHLLGGFAQADGIPVLVKIEAARFRRVVRPGETVRTKVAVVERVGPAWILTGHSSVGESSALRVRFVLSATDAMAASGLGG